MRGPRLQVRSQVCPWVSHLGSRMKKQLGTCPSHGGWKNCRRWSQPLHAPLKPLIILYLPNLQWPRQVTQPSPTWVRKYTLLMGWRCRGEGIFVEWWHNRRGRIFLPAALNHSLIAKQNSWRHSSWHCNLLKDETTSQFLLCSTSTYLTLSTPLWRCSIKCPLIYLSYQSSRQG